MGSVGAGWALDVFAADVAMTERRSSPLPARENVPFQNQSRSRCVNSSFR